jgi:L-alanine-DL-glutamate epimerase-like enolase superfamily enzyme
VRITGLRLHPVTVNREYGTVIAKEGGEARRTVQESHFLFVEVETDTGVCGWGEISDIEPDELPEPAEYEKALAGFVQGRDPFAVQKLHREFGEHFEGGSLGSLPRYTACALDMAFYDLQGKATGRSVSDLLGGAVRDEVTISWVAYIREELDLLRAEIREKTAEGFRAFKLKVGVDIDLDEERLATLRETAGKEASIKVDANEGWAVDEAIANITRLAKYDLAGVETPVPREEPADIAAVRKVVGVPILEHVVDPAYGLELIKADAVDAFNVATTGCGGLWPARQVAVLAEAAGLGVLIGSTVEMGPGTLAQLHLAAVTPNLTLPSDLIGPGMYTKDVLGEPLRYEKGKLRVPGGPGLGGHVDYEKLKRLARRHW